MKILIVHNDYGKYSGEEAVVDKMAAIFDSLGYDVAQLRTSTASARDSIFGKIKGFICGIYCFEGVMAMRNILKKEKPDIVNIHNLYPFISPAALKECKKSGVPVVMTVHNFRLMCPTGLFMRNGMPCELCLKKNNEWPCIKFNCEHSWFKSIGYAARNAFARLQRFYIDNVDVFACITEFQREKLIESGISADKITVIPNSIDAMENDKFHVGDYVAYSGRISDEKGVDLIIEVAKRHPEIPFRLAGAIRNFELVRNIPSNVILMGHINGAEFEMYNSNARFLIMASRCYEGFPMAILEAAKYGKTVIAPDHGGFTEIIGTGDDRSGILFTPSDVDSLEQKIVELWNDPYECLRLGKLNNTKLVNRFSTDVIRGKWRDLVDGIVRG